MPLNPFRPCEGSPTYQEEYRGNYIPKVIEREYGLQVVAPDTPYEQIEKPTVQNLEEYISIDEAVTGETVFVVLLARAMNRHNPELKLPVHEPAGDWVVTYDLDDDETLTKRADRRHDIGCQNTSPDCTKHHCH
ncbi:uncharacterized protein N7473_012064 [Penicillium subrubescens]|uniref:uncharacterized protein n=1 Tax=Penicillium subrubescens TaxID=1316194 RepID=UPI0025454CAC|nr:uncharacterized protein N7473_012064 [Penicillium subrubescens]KAJ5881011.1 hypothetical protein N7473_012064 [Penicillium subrubescens]